MDTETNLNTQEKSPKIVVIPPAVESLLEIDSDESIWPDYIKESQDLRQQIEIRKKVLKSLEKITANIPANIELTEAVEKGHVEPQTLSEFYKNLRDFLLSDTYNDRLILYLPFEIIPPKNWDTENIDLRESASKFLEIYIEKWYAFLDISDVRENFVEGDVLESELRDEEPERVVKVVHLIPKLMEKGILSIEDVLSIIEENPNQNLRNSIADILPILVDMRFITEVQLDEIVQKYNLNLDYRKPRVIPPNKISESRAKWLRDKDKPVDLHEDSAKLIDKPFSERKNIIQDDIEITKRAVELIRSNPELSKFIYPVCILFGSKIKGYSTINADTDIAIFIKPNTSIKEKAKINKLLHDTLTENKIELEIKEFWLKEERTQFEILNFESSDITLADNSWTYALFGGSWIGDQNIVRELYEKLLTNFFYSKDKIIFGGDARTIWLEQMEKDTLQYRLMHKGYIRLFERQRGIQTKHSDRIDGQSLFYDSGYRRLATKLYLSRVFLPQLDKPE